MSPKPHIFLKAVALDGAALDEVSGNGVNFAGPQKDAELIAAALGARSIDEHRADGSVVHTALVAKPMPVAFHDPFAGGVSEFTAVPGRHTHENVVKYMAKSADLLSRDPSLGDEPEKHVGTIAHGNGGTNYAFTSGLADPFKLGEQDRRFMALSPKQQHAELRRLQGSLGKQNAKAKTQAQFIEWLHRFKDWGLSLEQLFKLDTVKLEKNDCSRLHQALESFTEFPRDRLDGMPFILKEVLDFVTEKYLWKEVQTFIVQHDWAGAFEKAQDYGGSGVCLPYPRCAFELRVSGHGVIAVAEQMDPALPAKMFYLIEGGGMWHYLCDDTGQRLGEEVLGGREKQCAALRLVDAQVMAVCVALEAEAAVHDVVRQPAKLQKKREERGRLPLYDYRVVQLSRREKARALPGHGPDEYTRKRLHFRRGHWRHYSSHKVWVKWTLVGDPDLGFVDKEYKL